jgi:phosphotransferase system HPr (HPr) family protein
MTEISLGIRSQVVIIDQLGLHLRQAAKLAVLAKSFRSDILVVCGGKTANAKSILDLATLAAECGTTLDIVAHGPDAEDAVTALTDLFSIGLDGFARASVAA